MALSDLARHKLTPTLLVVGTLLLACAFAWLGSIPAFAHHPGSHAWRIAGTGQVRLEAVATAQDSCISIGAVTPGAPAGQAAPKDSFAVTVMLRRPARQQACVAEPKVLNDKAVLAVPTTLRRLHIFIVNPDGVLQATERVPIN